MMDRSPPAGHFATNTKAGWEVKSETNVPVREEMASPTSRNREADSLLADGVLVALLLSLPPLSFPVPSFHENRCLHRLPNLDGDDGAGCRRQK